MISGRFAGLRSGLCRAVLILAQLVISPRGLAAQSLMSIGAEADRGLARRSLTASFDNEPIARVVGEIAAVLNLRVQRSSTSCTLLAADSGHHLRSRKTGR
jgi:hypothetical protein